MFCQNSWGNLIDLADKLEHGIIGQVSESYLALRYVEGVSLAEDGVAIAGNDLSRFQSRPEVFCDGIVTEITADLFLHLLKPVKDFLVGSAIMVSIGGFLGHARKTHRPCRGPAKPLRPAESESIGELSALPTKCVV